MVRTFTVVGGGTLEFMVMETRKGFRPGLRKKVIRKNAYMADRPNPQCM